MANTNTQQNNVNTGNLETFAIIVFSRKALKDILATVKFRRGYDIPLSVSRQIDFAISQGFVFTRFRDNETLAKISDFTVTSKLQEREKK